MAQFVAALKSEVARLEDQLARARALLASYEAGVAAEDRGRVPTIQPNGAAERQDRSRSVGENSKEQRVRRAIMDLLRESGPTPRKAILAHLTSLGLMGHEANPLKTLGSYLSRWPHDLEPQGKGIWHCREL